MKKLLPVLSIFTIFLLSFVFYPVRNFVRTFHLTSLSRFASAEGGEDDNDSDDNGEDDDDNDDDGGGDDNDDNNDDNNDEGDNNDDNESDDNDNSTNDRKEDKNKNEGKSSDSKKPDINKNDNDRDGVDDKDDKDDDNDGIDDELDNEDTDDDNDGLENDVDKDDDNDGVPDSEDKDDAKVDEVLKGHNNEHGNSLRRLVNEKLKLEGEKKKSCEAKEASIKNRSGKLVRFVENTFRVFDRAASRVEFYYTSVLVPAGKTLSNYDSLVTDISVKKQVVEGDLNAAKNDASKFACDGTDPKGFINLFKDDMKLVKSDLEDYRTAVKNLVQAVIPEIGPEEDKDEVESEDDDNDGVENEQDKDDSNGGDTNEGE